MIFLAVLAVGLAYWLGFRHGVDAVYTIYDEEGFKGLNKLRPKS